MARIFLSYARVDGSEIANELVNRLRGLDHQVFFDVQSIRAGTQWRKELSRRIKWSDVIVVLVTPESNSSDYVFEEITAAINLGKAIIPIQVNDTPLPVHLRGTWQATVFTNNNYGDVLLEVERSLKEISYSRRVLPIAIVGVSLLVLFLILLVSILLQEPRDSETTLPSSDLTKNTIPNEAEQIDVSVQSTQKQAYLMDSMNATLSGFDFNSPTPTSISTEFLFVSNRNGYDNIYLADSGLSRSNLVANQGIRPIVIGNYDTADPAWSHDGNQIAYVSWESGNPEIYTLDMTTGITSQITQNGGIDRFPNWSPDDSSLVFASDRDGNPEIYVTRLADLSTVRLTENEFEDSTPVWSPDGSIVYTAHSDGNAEIYVMDSNGENQTNLTNSPSEDFYPVISSTGEEIAFTSDREDETFGIYIMGIDGADAEFIAFGINPNWSPNEKFLIYAATSEQYTSTISNGDIFIIPADGGYRRQITFNYAIDYLPKWKPK